MIMKKIIYVFVLIIIALSIMFSFALPINAMAEGEADNTTYELFVNFVTNCPNRTVATDNELTAASYIAAILETYGYGVAADMIEPFDFLEKVSLFYSQIDEVEQSSQNVVAYKRSANPDAKLMVIGTHYGNLAGRPLTTTTVIGGEGAYDNGTGVAALLAIASNLSAVELSFDIAFVFFGAELLDNAGSYAFIEQNSQEILGMINLVGVGGGDNLYAYYDEMKRSHGTFIDKIISDNDINILPAPSNRNLILDTAQTIFPYSHKGLDSSNAVFIENGIPSVNIFGYNWGGILASESATKPNISGKGSDTLENFIDMYGETAIRTKLNTVVNFVTLTVQEEGLQQTFETALSDNRYDNLTSDIVRKILKWAMLIGLAIALGVLSSRANRITRNAPPTITADSSDNTETNIESQSEDKTEKEDDIFNEF
ncbi:MAG: Zn-dependent exopeptidase M28 [Clostridia bacterium]|nr:Zn-dependent exopeptidase M28 [Clostridia bacterium]